MGGVIKLDTAVCYNGKTDNVVAALTGKADSAARSPQVWRLHHTTAPRILASTALLIECAAPRQGSG